MERIFRADRLVTDRLTRTPKELVWISSITAEEILSGTLSEINTAREQGSNRDVEALSRYLTRLIERLQVFTIFPYTSAAEEMYRSFPAAVKRIGKMDCRLAAHAITNNFIVVTCNTADFSRIPSVKIENWSKA